MILHHWSWETKGYPRIALAEETQPPCRLEKQNSHMAGQRTTKIPNQKTTSWKEEIRTRIIE